MPSRKEKTGYLLIGIFFGLVVAVSVFWWQRSIHKIDWVPFGTVKQLVNKLFDEPDDFLAQLKTRFTPGRSKSRGAMPAKPADTLALPLGDSLYNDSLSAYYNALGIDYYIDYSGLPDSMIIPTGQNPDKFGSDSLYITDTATTPANLQQEQETVKRDEFLSARIIRVEGIKDSLDRKGAYLDSLLTDERGARANIANKIRVEFWKSPINYKGYRLSKDKLVLFGIADHDIISLEYIQHQLYLRQKQSLYLLRPSGNFQALIPVKNPEKLNNPKK
jgi:hypothetical protein